MEFLSALDGGLAKDPAEALKDDGIIKQLIELRHTADWLNIKKILSKHKCLRHVENIIKKEIHDKYNIFDISPEKETQKLIGEVIKDSPAHGLSCCPRGWIVRDYIPGQDGAIRKTLVKADPLFGQSATEINVCAVPILIVEKMKSIIDENAYLRIAYKEKFTWEYLTIAQNKLLSSQHIVDCLASRGLPITSNTKGDVIDYLRAYLATNDEYIPTVCVSSQLGWTGTKKNPTAYGFLCGENFICNQVKTPQHKRRVIRFLGNSVGDEIEARVISPGGTYEDWIETIKGLNCFPRTEVALYASLSSALLTPLDLQGYVVDWSYDTSQGKSTALKVAASVWGRGEEIVADSPIKSWDSTYVGIENRAATLNNLPVILDDTKLVKKYPKEVFIPSIVYTISSGQGRIRGTKSGGTDVVRSWRTVLLSTGEQSITAFDKSQGTATRALCISGHPLNRDGIIEGDYAVKLNDGLKVHYGHAGPLFVQYIIKQRPHWPAWSKALRAIVENYKSKLIDEHSHGVSGRLAKPLGLLEFTGRLAHQALELPWVYDSPINDTILGDVSHGADNADQSVEALDDVMGWCSGNIHRFEGRHEYDPKYTTVGKWDKSATLDDWDRIYIIAKNLKEVLSHLGYDVAGVMKSWKNAGVTICEGKRTTVRTNIGNIQVHCVCFPRQQIEHKI